MASASSLDDYEVSHSEVMTYCLRVGIHMHIYTYRIVENARCSSFGYCLSLACGLRTLFISVSIGEFGY